MDKLIFDIGFHKGEDTLFYLLKGYKVIAVDADCQLIEKGQHLLKKYLESGELLLLNYAISEENDKDIDFFVSESTLWNSTNVSVASRMGNVAIKKRVKSKRLDSLFEEYGTPFYCKIDIEGNDIIALQTIEKVNEKPFYISVETECIGEDETGIGHEVDTLNCLYQLGYRRFKLIDQRTLTVLDKKCFYKNVDGRHWSEQMQTNRDYAKQQIELPATYRQVKFTDFFPGSSGPFGEELAGRWHDYTEAKELLIKHREDKMKLNEPAWTFWCDWHATF